MPCEGSHLSPPWHLRAPRLGGVPRAVAADLRREAHASISSDCTCLPASRSPWVSLMPASCNVFTVQAREVPAITVNRHFIGVSIYLYIYI